MLHDHIITKPQGMDGYVSHQLLEDLTKGQRPSFVDLGDRLIIRGEAHLTPTGRPLREVRDGDVIAFEAVCSCGVKNKGKHRYFPKQDWRSRRKWLERKSSDAGFKIRALSVNARSEDINYKGRKIKIDRTNFAGILKVTDAEVFTKVLARGLSGPAKAFGRGMIRLL